MKKILIAALFITGAFISSAQNRKVQVAILFDTSNSMDGLIDQAKSRIWKIINEISELTYNGQAPKIEIALYQYGNDGLEPSDNYIERVLDLTTDLDLISQKLFGLTTNGGSEFCGAVIGESLKKLNWSSDAADLKMIYIAGNEPFNQGPVDYKEQCKKAVGKGIFINTIYCGDYDAGVREFWKDGATCSEGDFFNIDSDKAIVHIDTPYDVEIQHYNDSLNQTYYGYGSLGMAKKEMQVNEDMNSSSQAPAVATERAISKSKGNVYLNTSWDLIDGVNAGEIDLKDIKDEELPEEFRDKTYEERVALLEEKEEERKRYQERIGELAVERENYISEEMKKRAEAGEGVDDFGTSVNKSILEKAKQIGYEKKAQDGEQQ